MRKSLLILLLCSASAPLQAHADTSTLTAAQRNTLGISQEAISQLATIYTAADASPKEPTGLQITKAAFANVAGNRQLWRIDFADNYPADNSNTVLYLDADNNAQTGRKDAGGIDLITWIENGVPRSRFFTADGTAKSGPKPQVVIKDNQIYFATDIDLQPKGSEVTGRLRIVAHTATPLVKVDDSRLFAFSGPSRASAATQTPTETTSQAAALPVASELLNPGFETAEGNRPANWTLANQNGSQSSWSLETTTKKSGTSALRLQKTNALGEAMLQSNLISATGKTQYQVSAQLNLPNRSAANVYLSVHQYTAGSDTPNRGVLTSPVRPLYSTSGQWQELRFYFTTSENVDRVQMNLVFAQAPINVLVDDFQLSSLDPTQYKPRFEPPTPETLMPLEEAQKLLEQRPRATAEVRKVGQRPRLFIDGQERVPLFYKTPGAWKLNRSQIGDFKTAGVNVYFISYILGRGIYQPKPLGGWLGKDKIDFSELNDLMWQILRADPEGYIVFDIMTDPYPEWGAENLDDVVTNAAGQKAIVRLDDHRWGGMPEKWDGSYAERYGHSYVSRKLREDTTKVLQEMDAYIKSSLPGKAVIGYYLNGGDDSQLFAWGDRSRQLVDYSKAAQEAFRDWLKVRYSTDAGLQKAWNKPDVTFATAQIPTGERRMASAFFLDPKTEQDIIDHNRFHSEGIVDSRNIYATALRQAHGTPIILGGYYSGPTIGVPSHRATGYQLKSGQLDFVTSVTGYFAPRLPGGPGKAHQVWSSLLLHNTIGLAEQDFRSWKSIPVSGPERDYQFVARVESAQESNALVRRDSGQMLAYGNGAWWFDLDGGWFNDPSIMKGVAETTNAFRQDLKINELPRAEVAVFVDEYSLDSINRQNSWTYQNALSEQIRQLNSSGAPYHLYLQSDLENAALPDYKLYLFLNAYHLTPGDLQAMEKLRRDGKTLAFMHAPGVNSQDALKATDSATAISKLTGISVQPNEAQSLLLQSSSGSNLGNGALVSYSTSGFTYGHNMTRSPFAAPTFAVTDPQAKPLATYQATAKTAVALRDFGHWKSLFYGGVGIDAFFFNALAREAGAWVAGPAGDAIYANQNFLTIHAMHTGEKNLRLLEAAKVTDLTDGKLIAPKTQTLNLSMQRGETRWFRLERP